MQLKKFGFILVLVILIHFISGCASIGPGKRPQSKPVETGEKATTNGWWAARFRISWPENEPPLWHWDLCIAHQIVAPVLNQHQSDISLWRFHRRAARDGSGHQFSFIFYSSPKTAAQIYRSLRSNALLADMNFAGVILKVSYEDTHGITGPEVKDTSDKNWPVSIQKTWPYFITGVSQMWLKLIIETAENTTPEPSTSSLQELDAFYKDVNASVIDLWQKQGRHAFLHHLNALFGYAPVIYYEKRYLNF